MSDDVAGRAASGEIDAQIAMGARCEAEGRTREARAWYAGAAKAGRADAARALALNLLTQAPILRDQGLGVMQAAARDGDAFAAYYWGLLAAAQTDLPQRWEIALACLKDAADRGLPRARTELDLLAPGGIDRTDILGGIERFALEPICEWPRIAIARNCLSPALCDWLIAQNRDRLGRASVYDPSTGGERVEGARSNSHVVFDLARTSYIVSLVRERIAASVTPARRLDDTGLLHYAPGEEFRPHYDYFDPALPGHRAELTRHGQRVATCLIYLNDDYEGGETEFLRLGLKHRGAKGDALVFWNVTTDGAPDPLTLHAGRPPTRGEKWLISQWLR